VRKALEHDIFPACKARLVATKGLLKGVTEIANLKGLYRVFERC
jgi:DNA mismatch repair protein MLH1